MGPAPDRHMDKANILWGSTTLLKSDLVKRKIVLAWKRSVLSSRIIAGVLLVSLVSRIGEQLFFV